LEHAETINKIVDVVKSLRVPMDLTNIDFEVNPSLGLAARDVISMLWGRMIG
jgi:hypothetical protein